MNDKELFFSKTESHKPQVIEIASEAGLHDLDSAAAREMISKWVMEDATAVGLEPLSSVGALKNRLTALESRQDLHRRRIALALGRFVGTASKAAHTRSGRIFEGAMDLGSMAARPTSLALLFPRVAFVRGALGRAEKKDAERHQIRAVASETLLALYEHYRIRGAAAATPDAKIKKVRT